MIIAIFGSQGSGKGTQAELLAEKFNLLHVSMGDCLRAESKKNTVLGKKIKSIQSSGNLVPVKITNKLFENILKKHKNLLLDGYPRSFDQLQFLMKKTKIDYAIEVDLNKRDSIKRISSRRMCPKCNRNYNLIRIKPKVKGKCDYCKTNLIQREDDKPAAIKKRQEIYKNQTLPLKKVYKRLGILHIVDGSGSIKQVHESILKILNCQKSPKVK